MDERRETEFVAIDSHRDAAVTASLEAESFAEILRSVRWLGRLVYTHNPFYLLSSWLVFSGLRMSFNTSGTSFETGALMLGRAG